MLVWYDILGGWMFMIIFICWRGMGRGEMGYGMELYWVIRSTGYGYRRKGERGKREEERRTRKEERGK